jgi:hypothetical protein
VQLTLLWGNGGGIVTAFVLMVGDCLSSNWSLTSTAHGWAATNQQLKLTPDKA